MSKATPKKPKAKAVQPKEPETEKLNLSVYDFETRRKFSLTILCSGMTLRPRAAQFLGGLSVDRNPMTEKQEKWFIDLVSQFADFQDLQREKEKAGQE